MMERADSGQRLYTRMRLWEFPDQYVIEPTDGSSGASMAVSRVDGSLSLIGEFASLVSSMMVSNICSGLYQSGCFMAKISVSHFLFVEELPDCSSSVRVPKIRTIFGVLGILKLVAGKDLSHRPQKNCWSFARLLFAQCLEF